MSFTSPPAPEDRGEYATAAANRNPAGISASEVKERRRILLASGAILLILASVVVLLRLQRLNELPPGLHRDEGIDGVLALRVLQGEHAIFFPVDQGREPSAIYALALSTSLLGRNFLAMRLPTALGSAAMVFALFWLGRQLFGRDADGNPTPWRGLLTGGAGAGLMAVSLSQTIIGRTSYNKVTHMPLLLVLCMALLWWGWSSTGQQRTAQAASAEKWRSWRRIALAGLCAGLLPYTYIPARFTPFLFLLFGSSFLLPWSGLADRKRWCGERSRPPRLALLASQVRSELPRALLFAAVTGLVAAPLLLHFALNPEHFLMRSKEVWLLRNGQESFFTAFLTNVWEHMMAFGWRGDPNWRHNFAGQSMLNPLEALFFWLGVALALWRWQSPAYRLLLLWLGILILPAMLSRDENVPHFLRMMGATPAIYLLAAAGLWEASQFILKRSAALPWHAAQTLSKNRTAAATSLGCVVGGLILVQGVVTYRTYFQVWSASPETYRSLETEWAELARTLNAQPTGPGTAYLVPYEISEMFSFKYLYFGASAADVVPAARSYMPQEIRNSLAALKGLVAVRLVDWNNDWIGGDARAEEHIALLLDKYGRYLGSDEFDSFRIHSYDDVNLDQPWSVHEDLEPLGIQYENGIDLLGLALGQGERQYSSLQPIALTVKRPLWLALQWQAGPGLAVNSSVSMRLHDSRGGMVYQKDAFLLDASHRQTSRWETDMEVDTIFYIDIPADLPPGEYELRLVVYNSETLEPTAGKGAGGPESVLARLRLTQSK